MTALLALAVALCAGVARAEDDVRRHFGVIVVHGHIDETIVTEGLEGIVQPAVFDRDHDPYQGWIEWANARVTASASALPQARARTRRATPPWHYTPTDFTYTPKTDWTYHRHDQDYTPKRDWDYTPKRNWTFRAKRYRSWA